MKLKNISLVICSLLFLLVIAQVNALDLTSYKISVNVTSDSSAQIVENWIVTYKSVNELENFKKDLISANIDLDRLSQINLKLAPHIYINRNNLNLKSVSYSTEENVVRIEYIIKDQCLIKYAEIEDKILWKLNENLFNYFIVNDLYYIPSDSQISISIYEPLKLEISVPSGKLEKNILIWSGISSNELRILAVEKEPPKPSFSIIGGFSQIFKHTSLSIVLLFLLVIIILYFIFRKNITKNIKRFVINN
ncbi:MAG: hypothetical protein V1824_01380 [archaeon]